MELGLFMTNCLMELIGKSQVISYTSISMKKNHNLMIHKVKHRYHEHTFTFCTVDYFCVYYTDNNLEP